MTALRCVPCQRTADLRTMAEIRAANARCAELERENYDLRQKRTKQRASSFRAAKQRRKPQLKTLRDPGSVCDCKDCLAFEARRREERCSTSY